MRYATKAADNAITHQALEVSCRTRLSYPCWQELKRTVRTVRYDTYLRSTCRTVWFDTDLEGSIVARDQRHGCQSKASTRVLARLLDAGYISYSTTVRTYWFGATVSIILYIFRAVRTVLALYEYGVTNE